MTREEAYQQYTEAIAKLDKESKEASDKARAELREQLKVLRDASHEELKAIRAISQKTRGPSGKC